MDDLNFEKGQNKDGNDSIDEDPLYSEPKVELNCDESWESETADYKNTNLVSNAASTARMQNQNTNKTKPISASGTDDNEI